MNLYDILNISKDATYDEIKSSYKLLAKKYHPDKNKDPSAIDKFKEIQSAYEILSDKQKRQEYDSLSSSEKIELYDALREYFNKIIPNYTNAYDTFVKNYYGDENDLKTDVNMFNLKGIYDKFFINFYKKLKESIVELDDIPIYTSLKSKEIVDLDIYHTIYTTISEKYDNIYREIIVKRKSTSSSSKYFVPLREDSWTLFGAGEIGSFDKIGNVIINIKCAPDEKYIALKYFDLAINVDISLYDYLYGNIIDITLPNGNIIPFELPSCIDKTPFFVIKEMGMPYDDSFGVGIIDKNNIKRGDLYLHLKIKDIDVHKNKIKELFSSIQN